MNRPETNDRPVPRPGIQTIDPYVPGKSGAGSAGKIFKLSSNDRPKPSLLLSISLANLKFIPTDLYRVCDLQSPPVLASIPTE